MNKANLLTNSAEVEFPFDSSDGSLISVYAKLYLEWYDTSFSYDYGNEKNGTYHGGHYNVESVAEVEYFDGLGNPIEPSWDDKVRIEEILWNYTFDSEGDELKV